MTPDDAPSQNDECRSANPFGWVEIYVADMARARAFYTAVFGHELTAIPSEDLEMWSFPMGTGYGASGALVHMEGMEPGGNSIVPYFNCADCAVESGRVAGAGGSLVRPKFAIGEYGHIALALDSEGNMIGFHSMN
jgi:predicted enzyme related to lactoylglutathione lyase